MNKTSFAAKAKAIGKKMFILLRHIVLHNGWVKLLALLISLILWAGLISQDETLTRDKTWQNVNVSVNGTDAMKRNGYIVVSDLDEMLSNVSVTAAVPQKQYESAEVSAYNIRVDLSRINGTGAQEMKILSTTSAAYGKVTNTVPSVLNVEVEEYLVRQRIPITVTIGGDYQNGWYKDWYMPSPSVDPLLVAVSGPRSLVQNILKAKVELDPETIEWAEGSMLSTGMIRLYDRSNNEIQSSLLDITTEGLTIDTVLIEGVILPAKNFDISGYFELQGKVQDGYRVASMRVSPENVKVAAKTDVLEQLDELLTDRIINLDGLNETTTFQMKIQKPSEDAVLSNDTVTVTVEIEPEDSVPPELVQPGE